MKKFLILILAIGAMLSGAAAGHLFYLEKFTSGIAMLVMTLIFLSYAMSVYDKNWRFSNSGSDNGDDDDEDDEKSGFEIDFENGEFIRVEKFFGDISLLIADTAISSLKNIGRTIPPSIKEITDTEEKINNLLNQAGVAHAKRENLKEEFNKLKDRTRRNEGGAAIMRNSRL